MLVITMLGNGYFALSSCLFTLMSSREMEQKGETRELFSFPLGLYWNWLWGCDGVAMALQWRIHVLN